MPWRGPKCYTISQASRDLGESLVQTLAQSRLSRGVKPGLRALYHGVWKSSKEGDSTISLHPGPAPWLSLWGKFFFLNPAWNSPGLANVSHSPTRHCCEEPMPIPVFHFCLCCDAVRCSEAISAPTEPDLAPQPLLVEWVLQPCCPSGHP